jgi:HAD superfamily hydrolase (TIGR01509 family)
VSRPGAVVFDCDGVLVDSEPHSVTSWLAVLGGLGHPATARDVEACVGLGYRPTRDYLAAIAPLPGHEELWPALLSALSDSYRMGLHRYEDAIAVIYECERRSIPVAVATASPRQRLDLTLGAARLSGRFAVSVAGDEVEHAKPAPDVYLRAAFLLGVDPHRCAAVEDTPIGAEAALAAGMATVAVVRAHGDRSALEATGALVVEEVTLEGLGIR